MLLLGARDAGLSYFDDLPIELPDFPSKNVVLEAANSYSYGPLQVISVYNPIYRMYNQLQFI